MNKSDNTTGYPVIDEILQSIRPRTDEEVRREIDERVRAGKECTCHKFISLHDGDCDVHGRVRKQAEEGGREGAHTLSDFRVEYVKPDYSRGHSFESRCAILADDAALGGVEVRVFDVPDPDESQREVAEWACGVMNEHGQLVSALRDCVESLKRLPDVDDAYRITCIRQAERALADDEFAQKIVALHADNITGDFDSPILPVGATELGKLFEHTPDEGEPHPATECESRGCVNPHA